MQISRFTRCSLFFLILAIPAAAFAGVLVSVTIAPPVLPVYSQPPCPGDGYIWTPGYWAYGPDGYYWVPGTWVVAPTPGLLWTPGYWGWNEGFYVWHPGYWGPHIGFYGGVNYGFGYFGVGYAGGYWHGGTFFYNRTVNNVNITNVHIYNKTVINNVTVNNVSYNGGARGIRAQPSPAEQMAYRERHFEPTNMQMQHEHAAGNNRELLASVNRGRPAIAATSRPGEFDSRRAAASRPNPASYGRADSRPMNREVPRPQESAHNVDRPMPRHDGYGNRGGQSVYNAPRPEDRGGPAPRPSAYHEQQPYHPDGARPQEGTPRNRREDRGNEHGQH